MAPYPHQDRVTARYDTELVTGIDALLIGAGVPADSRESRRKQIIYKFMDRLADHCSDGKMPEKRAVMERVLNAADAGRDDSHHPRLT
jgi:hypothetical protein